MDSKRIGFIGTGVMGAAMAGHLMRAGHKLTVHNRTRARAEALLAAGAQWADTPRQAARDAEVVITIVGFPRDVEETCLGPHGVLAGAAAGTVMIDMTTSRPDLAREIYRRASRQGVAALDAPVSGGDSGAREARLSIMVGGDEPVFDRMRPLFACMGRTIVYQGGAGSGQYTKMCNQIAIASNMLGVCEAMHYALAAGLQPGTVLESIASGAAGSWSLSNLAPRALQGDYAPGFMVKHFLKDMGIALESAQALGLKLPGLECARRLYDALAAAGGAEQGTQALFRLYRESRLPDLPAPDRDNAGS